MEITTMHKPVRTLQPPGLHNFSFNLKARGSAPVAALLTIGMLLVLTAVSAPAQTVYRVIGADGRITFSDKPPVSVQNGNNKANDKANLSVTATDRTGRQLDLSGTALPFELRQTVSRYPVTLYSANNCAPCASGRSFLSARGIPFAERSVNTPEDAEALARIGGEASLPFLTVGGQKIKGYSDAEWTQFLDAAGYPSDSKLPSNYRNSPVTPLVALQKPATQAQADAATDATRAPASPPAARVDNTSNPAGIRF